MLKAQETCYDLQIKINRLRALMVSVGMSKGLNHTETLKYSEELDKLILKYQQSC